MHVLSTKSGCSTKVATTCRKKTFKFSITEAISKQIFHWGYLLRFSFTIILVIAVILYDRCFNPFHGCIVMVEGLDEWVEGIVKGETMAANDGNVATTSLTVGGDNGEVSTLRNGHITQIYKVLGLIGNQLVSISSIIVSNYENQLNLPASSFFSRHVFVVVVKEAFIFM